MRASGMVSRCETHPVETKNKGTMGKTNLQLIEKTEGVMYITIWSDDVKSAPQLSQGDHWEGDVRNAKWTDREGKQRDGWTLVTPRATVVPLDAKEKSPPGRAVGQ